MVQFFNNKSKTDLFMSTPVFIFSSQTKHTNVNIVSSSIAKVSGGASGYKFAVMTPNLDSSKPVKFGFKMQHQKT